MRYLTDGNIEVLYDKNAGIVITIMEVKEKFLPITQFIKPSVLKQIETKKENKKMKKAIHPIGACPDCGSKNVEITIHGICNKCQTRKINAIRRGKEYIPYVNLSPVQKRKIDAYKEAQRKRLEPDTKKIENYYQAKANQSTPTLMTPTIPIANNINNIIEASINPLSDSSSLVKILRNCGCEIPEKDLNDVLDVLISTNKLKDIFMTIASADCQQALLDLEQALNVVERKLQHDWEFNGFREEDDIKFKGFLTWRRILKGAIFFWKKLYQTGTLVELQKAWNSYTADPNDKVLLSGDRIDSKMKRYQITTDSISTIFNSRKPFTRVFYAVSKEKAYELFLKWMSDRQLHEDKSKTTIIELVSSGEDARKEEV